MSSFDNLYMRTVEVVVINLDPDGELKSLAISHRLDSLLVLRHFLLSLGKILNKGFEPD